MHFYFIFTINRYYVGVELAFILKHILKWFGVRQVLEKYLGIIIHIDLGVLSM